jgi:hypothetical protein
MEKIPKCSGLVRLRPLQLSTVNWHHLLRIVGMTWQTNGSESI